jgi:hypothetical protein
LGERGNKKSRRGGMFVVGRFGTGIGLDTGQW